jgi:hypothetical protein
MIFRINFPKAFRANAVAEFGFRMIPDVGLDLIPVSLIVPDFFTRCTDGKEAA